MKNGGENYWRMEGETLRMEVRTFGEWRGEFLENGEENFWRMDGELLDNGGQNFCRMEMRTFIDWRRELLENGGENTWRREGRLFGEWSGKLV